MALSYIWSGFILVGLAAAMAQWLFMGDVEVFKRIVDGIFSSSKVAFIDIALP
jgi:spore maturation protein SpmA